MRADVRVRAVHRKLTFQGRHIAQMVDCSASRRGEAQAGAATPPVARRLQSAALATKDCGKCMDPLLRVMRTPAPPIHPTTHPCWADAAAAAAHPGPAESGLSPPPSSFWQ
ncbi:hypothetical protein PLESTM_001194000 [Pleodorina starrii]|nr:hypothetical protein PLESTM_001194000 [Pleodorina starrii]